MSILQPAQQIDGVYQNPVETKVGLNGHGAEVFRRLLFGKEERTPRRRLGPFVTNPQALATPPAAGLRVTVLGHSTLLFELDGTTVLTDPVFSQRASMVQWFGPRRFFQPPLPMHDLPHLDAILVSHDHYDHLDKAAVQKLSAHTPLFVTSLGVGAHLQRWGIPASKIYELNWMDSFTVPSASATPLTITALPARHFSGRTLKRNTTLWSSFQLKTAAHNLYHGADSGYYDGFREIGDTFGPFDLATLEIGAFDPLWGHIHLGPDNALRAAQDLRARAVLPIHFGLFNLAFHPWYQPPERFTQVAAQAGMPVFLPQPGTPTEFTGAAHNSLWWRRYMQPQTQVVPDRQGNLTLATEAGTPTPQS